VELSILRHSVAVGFLVPRTVCYRRQHISWYCPSLRTRGLLAAATAEYRSRRSL